MDPQLLILCFVLVALFSAALAWLLAWLYFRAVLARQEERLFAAQDQLRHVQSQIEEQQKMTLAWQGETVRSREALARLESTLTEERKSAEEKQMALKEAQELWAAGFKALSADALKSNNEAFLQLAQGTLEKFQTSARTDLDKRQLSLNQWFAPVQETLSRFDNKLSALERARVEAYSSLSQQIHSMALTQQTLSKALGTPRIRGRWGELQLRRVVEIAGMLAHCDFDEQPSTTTEAGRLRPDLVVRLPGNKTIVVDAKTPMDAYLEAMETNDDNLRRLKLKDHARAIREHMFLLSKKGYWTQFPNSPELAILFLPGENFFSSALEHDPGLMDQDIASTNVVLATPITLIALLKVVAYGWQQEALAQNAQVISDLGRELHDRIATLGGHWGKLGTNLKRAVESYNESVNSLERRLLVSARRFRDLKANSNKEIEDLQQIDVMPIGLQELPLEFPEPTVKASRSKNSAQQENRTD